MPWVTLRFVDCQISGHDTAAAAMSFVLLVLSNHPEVMKKLQDEVDEKFAGVEMSQENTSAVKVSASLKIC